MSYAAIMVYVEATEMPEKRVRIASGLADEFNAALIGLSAIDFRPPMRVEGILVDGTTDAEMKEMSTQLAGKASWFRGLAGRVRRGIEWRPIFDFPAVALAREARCADLIILPRTCNVSDAYSSLDSGAAILRLGRPALVVPDEINRLSGDRVVIGWKDSREARRAVQDALPFLHRASRVTIVESCTAEENNTERMDDIYKYLIRHEIKCGPMIRLEQSGSVAKQLIDAAVDEKADLIVTGAYGHSRLGEWMFGGVTHNLLSISPISCIMSH